MNRRVTYKAKLYPSRNVLIKHTADIDFLNNVIYKRFCKYTDDEFREQLKDKMFRNDIQHFIQFTCWVKRMSGRKMRFLVSDYGALHLLTHMEWDDKAIEWYSKSVQAQIRDFCKIKKWHHWLFWLREGRNKH